MANFQDILSKTGTSKPPEALPIGTYLGIIDGIPEITKVGKNQTDAVDFSVKPVQAQPDVVQEDLARVLNGKSLQDKKIRYRLFLTEDAIWRFDRFMHHLGLIQTNAAGEFVLDRPRSQLIQESMGKQVLLTMGHRPSEDGQQLFGEVKSTARV